MPSRKSLCNYPPEYREIFLKAHSNGMHFIPFPSKREAENFRKSLYNYRIALWEDTVRPETQDDHKLISISERLIFSIGNKTLYIIYRYSSPKTSFMEKRT